MKDKWLNDIKDRLSDYEMEAPEGLWESIQSKTDAEPIKRKNTRIPLWQRVSAVAAAAVIVLLCGWHLWRLSDNVDNLQPTRYIEIAAENHINTVKSSSLEKPSIAQVVDNEHSEDNRISTSSRVKQQFSVEEKIVSSNNNLIGDTEKVEESPSIDNTDKSSEGNDGEVKNLPIYKGVGDDYISNKPTDRYSRNKRTSGSNNRFALGVSSTVGSVAIRNTVAVGNLALTSPIDSVYNNDNSYYGEEAETRSADSSSRYMPDSDRDEISHHVPLKIGLTFMYRFNNVLAFETGVQYSNLKSDIKYNGSSTLFRDAKQSLHYLGIPVNLKYTPVSWKRLSVYLSGGFSFEKCIYGNLKGNLRTQNSPSVNVESIRINQHPFQVSANVGAGLQFAITDFCGIYAEPTLGYYFDDGSSLCTIYKEHPWNFNLNVGLRFSIGK